MHTTKKQRDSNKTVLQRLVGAFFFFFNEAGTFLKLAKPELFGSFYWIIIGLNSGLERFQMFGIILFIYSK